MEHIISTTKIKKEKEKTDSQLHESHWVNIQTYSYRE